MVPGIFDAPHDDSASVTRLGYSSLDPVDVGVSLLINDDLPAMAIGAWGRLEAVIAPDALCTYCDPDEALTPPPGVFAASDSPSGNDDESTVNDSDPRKIGRAHV